MNPAIVWFRHDLRVTDHPALHAAVGSKRPLICLYVHDELPPLGGAARWWLHASLHTLDETLTQRGSRLTLLRGAATDLVPKLATHLAADAVYWNRRYDRALPLPRLHQSHRSARRAHYSLIRCHAIPGSGASLSRRSSCNLVVQTGPAVCARSGSLGRPPSTHVCAAS